MFAQVQYTPRAQFGPKLEALFRRHGSPISAVVEDHVETPQLSPSIPANGAHYHAINSSFFTCKADPTRWLDKTIFFSTGAVTHVSSFFLPHAKPCKLALCLPTNDTLSRMDVPSRLQTSGQDFRLADGPPARRTSSPTSAPLLHANINTSCTLLSPKLPSSRKSRFCTHVLPGYPPAASSPSTICSPSRPRPIPADARKSVTVCSRHQAALQHWPINGPKKDGSRVGPGGEKEKR